MEGSHLNSPTNILVTGANGQLGLTIQDMESNNNTLSFIFKGKSELDITNKREIEILFNQYKFNYCINCAAYTNVEQAEKAPEIAYRINGDAVKNLAEVCKQNNTVLIHLSTDYVFSGEKHEPYTINDVPNPINEYGRSKLLGEEYVQDILKRYFIIRTSWLYSKRHGKNFYKTILEKTKTEKELVVTTEQVGCPTDTVNLALYILDLIYKNKSTHGIHHFCDEKPMTWYEFAKLILEENAITNQIKLLPTMNNCTFAKRPKNSVLSTQMTFI
jgi:dTDP-4-dehydrorhamnose reductase